MTMHRRKNLGDFITKYCLPVSGKFELLKSVSYTGRLQPTGHRELEMRTEVHPLLPWHLQMS